MVIDWKVGESTSLTVAEGAIGTGVPCTKEAVVLVPAPLPFKSVVGVSSVPMTVTTTFWIAVPP